MDDSAIGQTISHYRIVERLGGGGMGIVYKAVDVRLNRFVALKFLAAALTREPEAKERFVHEAQAASALDHPNICTIYEIDETEDRELFLSMAYYEGETLKARIQRGPLAIADAVEIAIEVTQALARSHGARIIHRDIKPANVMLPTGGPVKIVDFGLAKLVGHSDWTKTGTTVGTVAYMAPEQIRGSEPGPEADLWAVGVVLYEMIAGCRPFEAADDLAVISRILDTEPLSVTASRPDVPVRLQRVLAKALAKDVAQRYRSAADLLADLHACRDAPAGHGPASPIDRLLRRRAVRVAAAAAVLVVVGGGLTLWWRASRARWAREEALPQIAQDVAKDDYAHAFATATEAERYVPKDPELTRLWAQFSAVGTVVSAPPGADVSVRPYNDSRAPWTPLGRTPIDRVRLARGAYRLRIEKTGFEPVVLASRNPGTLLGNGNPTATLRPATAIAVALRPQASANGMVWVAGGAFPVGLTGFNSDQRVPVDAFQIDRYEVTNKDFKAFVDRGGYANDGYWRDVAPAVRAQFTDTTGRPGPSSWELGGYPSGQADYPVAGVSWFEAVAYCRSVGKALPTIFHWARAGLSPVEIGTPMAPSIVPMSNFSGKTLARIGAYDGLGPYGTYDMAGNAREWVWNEAANGRRWILGGAFNEPEYMFTVPDSLPPQDRSSTNGFRCAVYDAARAVPPALFAHVETYSRDNLAAKAVSDEVFDVFRRQYAYVRAPLNDRVESRRTDASGIVRETITLDAAYEPGRVTAYLFLPAGSRPPYQLVVFFPGVGPFSGRGSSDNLQLEQLDFIPKSGRALLYPVYKGSFERWDPFVSLHGEEYLRTFRVRMGQWRQDLGRALDAATARPDIVKDRVAYYGASFGASTAFPLIALEDRLKVAVLGPAGFTYRELPPEADALNYVSRVTIPVLMLGGSHDYIFPPETAQKPMFERLGTPRDRKRHVVFDAGHGNFPRSEMIREVLAWLDTYLGPVAPR